MSGNRTSSRIVTNYFSTGSVFVYFAARIRRSAVFRVSGVTGAWAERRTPGIQRIVPSASQTTGRPHRSSRGIFRSIRISFTFFSPPRASLPASRPNGRIRSPARKGRTVSGNVRPAASNTSASPFAARRFACAAVLFPLDSQANVTIRPCLAQRNFVLPGSGDRDRRFFPGPRPRGFPVPSVFSRYEERLFVPVGQLPPLACVHSRRGTSVANVPVHRLEQPLVRRDSEPIEADPLEDLHPQDGRQRGERFSSESDAVPDIFTFRRIHLPASASR